MGKRVLKLEHTNKNLMEDLKSKIQQVSEMEKQLEATYENMKTDENNLQNEEMEQIANSLMEENAELREQLTHQEDIHAKAINKYKREIQNQKRELNEVFKYYDNPDKKLSMKKAVDFIRLENEIRQKNLYIDSLLDKIREMQGTGREFSARNNQQLRISSRNDTKNSIENSRISNNR